MSAEFLFNAIGEIDDRIILAAAEAMEGKRNGHAKYSARKIIRIVLIAAIIMSFFVASAYGIMVWSRSYRQVDLAPDSKGTARYAVIPNGFEGSPTYSGSAKWWNYVTDYKDEHGDSLDYSFTDGDDEKRSIAWLYRANTPELLDKLYEIAEEYELELYTETLSFDNPQRMYELSGMDSFTEDISFESLSGYVFKDASVHMSGVMKLDGQSLLFSLNKVKSGSIYPYSGPMTYAGEWEELICTTELGYDVSICLFNDNEGCIFYLSPDREKHIEIFINNLDEEDVFDTVAQVADRIDFNALCKDNVHAKNVLDVPRGAMENRTAMQRLIDLGNSNMFTAAREFQDFYTETFYGACFDGTHGMPGYEDIDERLESLAGEYDLRYAKDKYVIDTVFGSTTVWDNGAWYAHGSFADGREYNMHYIPKDALYTRMVHYIDFEEYQRAWLYTPESMTECIVIFSHGPEKISGTYLFHETDNAYILVQVYSLDPAELESRADQINWLEIGEIR